MPQVLADDKQPPSVTQITSDREAHPDAPLFKRDFWENHVVIIKEKHNSYATVKHM